MADRTWRDEVRDTIEALHSCSATLREVARAVDYMNAHSVSVLVGLAACMSERADALEAALADAPEEAPPDQRGSTP
jgi:hypothetical protein